MKNSSNLVIIILVILLLGVGVWVFLDRSKDKSAVTSGESAEVVCTMEAKLCPDGSYVGRSGPKCEFDACPQVVDTHSNIIKVTSPLPNATVASPMVVKGEARGNWYFEASFPVKLLDANGKQLVIVPAQAIGEWMTTDFVPFEVTLTFPKPSTPTGTLVLMKDNPSGEARFDDSISIPVVFAQ